MIRMAKDQMIESKYRQFFNFYTLLSFISAGNVGYVFLINIISGDNSSANSGFKPDGVIIKFEELLPLNVIHSKNAAFVKS